MPKSTESAASPTPPRKRAAKKAVAEPEKLPVAPADEPSAVEAPVVEAPVVEAPALEAPGKTKGSDENDAAAYTSPQDAAAAATGLRIVIAEDETLIRVDLAEMLAESGYRVVGQASNGEQAVELARELRPDLVIMDVKMPVLDGISAAEQIGGSKIAPVIMLTAFSQKELVERARDAGVMAYIVKPFTQTDLGPAIDIARSRWEERASLEAEIADLGERLETRKAVDRAKGILMTQLKVTEHEAFRWIQKTAMDRRLGMREVAEAVIEGMSGNK